MCKMIARVIKRAIYPPPPEANEEKIELVKADALAADNEADEGGSTQGSNAGGISEALHHHEEGQNDPEVQR